MFIAPVLLAVIFVYSLVKHQPIKYGEFYSFPEWADGIGWILALVSMVQIPTWAFFVLCQKGFVSIHIDKKILENQHLDFLNLHIMEI